MQHRGEILQEAVRKSGIPLSRVARQVGKSRTWLYNQFESQDVGLDVLLEIGKAIHHDFTVEIDELSKLSQNRSAGFADEQPELYQEQNAGYWKNKYMQLLEEFNAYMREHGKPPISPDKKKSKPDKGR
ncbi:MAG: hypothetical protein R2850_03560 [Bacteroidia bacterium]